MKLMENIDVTVEQDGSRAEAIIIGSGVVAESLDRLLVHRQAFCAHVPSQKEVNLTLSPDYIFWFPGIEDELPSELVLNFAQSLAAKIIIVYDRGEAFQPALAACLDRKLDARAIVLIDLFGPGVDHTPLSIMWSQLDQQQVMIPDNDSLRLLPLYVDDAANAVCLAAFSSQSYGKVIYVPGPEEAMLMNFAYRIREEVGRVTGKVPTLVPSTRPLPAGEPGYRKLLAREQTYKLLSFRPEIGIAEGLRRLVSAELRVKKKTTPDLTNQPPLTPKHPRRLDRRSAWRKLLLGGGVALMLAGLFMAPLQVAGLVNGTLQREVAQLLAAVRQDNREWEKASQRVGRLASVQEYLLWLSAPAAELMGGESSQQYESLQAESNGLTPVMIVAESLQDASQASSVLTDAVAGRGDQPAAGIIDDMDAALTKLIAAAARLPRQGQITAQAALVRADAAFVRELLPALRWAIGIDRKVTLLLVLQNSAELRPTGGFMGSVGFASFEKGKLLDFATNDIYQIDSQLTGTQDPPAPIRSRLGEQNWLARDANWAADAPSAASHIQQVVERATGRVTDGVIFITSDGLRRLLTASGPVTIQTGETITADNVLDRMTFNDGVEISGKRQEVAADVLKALSLSLSRGDNRQLGAGILDALRHQEILVVSRDPAVSAVVQRTGVDGSVQSGGCPTQFHQPECIADYVFVVDANLGVNRADHFLRRERTVAVRLMPDTTATTTVSLRYLNTARSTAYPAGAYRGYTRLYTPLSAAITSVVEVMAGKRVAIESDSMVEYGKHATGFYLEVPVGEERIIEVTYAHSGALPLVEGVGGYALLLQKQPGTGEVPTTVSLDYGPTVAPVVTWPEPEVQSGSLLFRLRGDQTARISAEFATVL